MRSKTGYKLYEVSMLVVRTQCFTVLQCFVQCKSYALIEEWSRPRHKRTTPHATSSVELQGLGCIHARAVSGFTQEGVTTRVSALEIAANCADTVASEHFAEKVVAYGRIAANSH